MPIRKNKFASLLLISLILSSQVIAKESNYTKETPANRTWSFPFSEEEPCGDLELEAHGQPALCIGAELYGAIHREFVESKEEGHDRSRTDYRAIPILRVVLPETRGWTVSGVLEGELDETENRTTAAYVTLGRDSFWLDFGLLDIGGADQGNEFVTELGEEATGDYGDRTEEQTYLQLGYSPLDGPDLAVAYSIRQGDISFEEDDNEGDTSHLHFILEWEIEEFTVGGEYERIDCRGNRQNISEEGERNQVWDSEYTLGIGMAWEISDWITPFINYGELTENSEDDPKQQIKTTEINAGMDLWLRENLGLTLGYEKISDDGKQEEGQDTAGIQNAYIVMRYVIGKAHIGLSYWWSDQQVREGDDNLKGQLDLELALIF